LWRAAEHSKHKRDWDRDRFFKAGAAVREASMYAVIRSGGKQYRVAPGDIIRVEKLPPSQDGNVEFGEVLVVSGSDGQIGRPQSQARVTGRILGEGRGDKVLVFHYKRKKQYKKLAGHRQPFTAVRIMEIAFDGQSFTAPEQPEPQRRKAKTAAEASAETASAPESQAKARAPKKAAPRKAAGKKSAPKKKK
jgi:large subunit ribosomal protein L21